MNNKVISMLEYKLNKLNKRFGEQADTHEKFTESVNNYNKEAKKLRESLFKNNKHSYRDLEKYIGDEFKNIKQEPVFDWKRRKSTL